MSERASASADGSDNALVVVLGCIFLSLILDPNLFIISDNVDILSPLAWRNVTHVARKERKAWLEHGGKWLKQPSSWLDIIYSHFLIPVATKGFCLRRTIFCLFFFGGGRRVVAGSCHKRQKPQAPTPQAPIRNRQTRKVANARVLNRNTNLT